MGGGEDLTAGRSSPEQDFDDDAKIGEDVQQGLTALQASAVPGFAGVPSFVNGNLAMVRERNEEALRPVVAAVAPLFRVDAANLQFLRSRLDEQGHSHVRYRQVKNGLPVVGGDLVMHINAQGTVYSVNGTARDGVAITASTLVSPDAALNTARGANKALALPITGDRRLVYLISNTDGLMRLAYEVEVKGETADGMPVRDLVYVDAKAGKVIERHPKIHTARNRQVYSANNGTSTPGTLKRSEGGAANADAIVNTNYDLLGNVYDYYNTIHGRDSYNNAGAALISTVHYSTNYVNAYWDGTQMVYGDGQLPTASNLAASLDVTGHELTHAVTENESNLTYSGQSGGINESMSDIFGESVEAWVHGSGNDNFTDSSTFLVGDDIWTPATPGDALRYMDDPVKDGDSLDDYSSYSSGVDVHYSSGIPNLMWSLLVKGGVHPRGRHPEISVPSIGKAKASKIFYKANADILTASSNFQALRTATAQAALQLYDQATADAVNLAASAVGIPGGAGGGGGTGGGAGGGGGTGGGTGGGGGSSTDIELTNNVPVTGLSGATGAQAFYKIVVPAGSTNLAITISGGTGDVDLYTRLGSRPTSTTYDCRPYASGNAETCTVAAPSGTYFIMLNGYAAYSGVTLRAAYTPGGTGGGAGGGTGGGTGGGSGGGGGSGDIVLTSGTPVTGISGAASSEKFYVLNVPANSSSVVFRTSGGTGDVDLYVRSGSRPTTTTYTCRPYVSGNNETCTINTPAAGSYFVMLRGYSAYSGVTLTGTVGGSGDTVLTNNQPLNGIAGALNSKQYYVLSVPAGTTRVTFTTTGGSGDADLYIGLGSRPTTTSNLCKSEGASTVESCVINAPAAGNYYVMLNGYSAFSGVTLRGAY